MVNVENNNVDTNLVCRTKDDFVLAFAIILLKIVTVCLLVIIYLYQSTYLLISNIFF